MIQNYKKDYEQLFSETVFSGSFLLLRKYLKKFTGLKIAVTDTLAKTLLFSSKVKSWELEILCKMNSWANIFFQSIFFKILVVSHNF